MEQLLWWKRDTLILLVLGWSNFLPILGRHVLRGRFTIPVDLGIRWFDGRTLFGAHKTVRGLIFSAAGTSVAGYFTPLGWLNGLKISLLAMSGDLLSSFAKRRLGLKSGDRFPVLDQVPESFLPLALLKHNLSISWCEIIAMVIIFVLFQIALSPPLYRMGVRRKPH